MIPRTREPTERKQSSSNVPPSSVFLDSVLKVQTLSPFLSHHIPILYYLIISHFPLSLSLHPSHFPHSCILSPLSHSLLSLLLISLPSLSLSPPCSSQSFSHFSFLSLFYLYLSLLNFLLSPIFSSFILLSLPFSSPFFSFCLLSSLSPPFLSTSLCLSLCVCLFHSALSFHLYCSNSPSLCLGIFPPFSLFTVLPLFCSIFLSNSFVHPGSLSNSLIFLFLPIYPTLCLLQLFIYVPCI